MLSFSSFAIQINFLLEDTPRVAAENLALLQRDYTLATHNLYQYEE
jgi:hypothetical protein